MNLHARTADPTKRAYRVVAILGVAAVASLITAACGNDVPSTDASAVTDAVEVIDSVPVAYDAWQIPDARQPPDARLPPDLCDVPPVADPITISGVARQTGPGDDADIVVDLRGRLDNALVATTLTDSSGDFSFTVATNGSPLDVYVAASKPGFITSNWVPPEPYRESTSNVEAFLATAAEHGQIAALAGTSSDPQLGDIWVVVVECDGTKVIGATVDTLPVAGTLVYGDDLPNPLLSSTTSYGIAYAFNVPVGSVEVSAMTGAPFAVHDVPAFAGELTLTTIHP